VYIFALARSSVASASCAAGPGASTIWPKDGAIDVPVDTPIVVDRYWPTADPGSIETTLTSADGTQQPLEQAHILPPPYMGCTGETLFLKPAHKLKAGATFTLTHSTPSKGVLAQSQFTVGERSADPEAEVTPDITYLRVYSRTECVKTACTDDVANVQVDLGEPPVQPLWLRITGSGFGETVNDWVFYPAGYNAPEQDSKSLAEAQLSVPLAAGESCVSIDIYGIEGRSLYSEKRCTPERCAVYAIRSITSGNGPASAPINVDQVADGTCQSPPVLDMPPSITYPAASGTSDIAVEPDGPKGRSSSSHLLAGCSLSHAGSVAPASGRLASLLMLLLVALCRRARQRRVLAH
jgi:hypothetical protein